LAVLQHEGTIEILYRDFAMPTGARFTEGYLARPDRIGAYPVVVLLPPLQGITPFVKDLARRLARNRYAVLVPDLTRGVHPGPDGSFEDLVGAYRLVRGRRALADIDDAVAFAFNDPAGWAREGKIGLVGIDVGGRFAINYAAHRRRLVGALCVAYAPLAVIDLRSAWMPAPAEESDPAIERTTRTLNPYWGRWVVAWVGLKVVALPAPALPGSGSAGVFSGPVPVTSTVGPPRLVSIRRLTHSAVGLATAGSPTAEDLRRPLEDANRELRAERLNTPDRDDPVAAHASKCDHPHRVESADGDQPDRVRTANRDQPNGIPTADRDHANAVRSAHSEDSNLRGWHIVEDAPLRQTKQDDKTCRHDHRPEEGDALRSLLVVLTGVSRRRFRHGSHQSVSFAAR